MVSTELAHLWKLVIYGQSVSRSGSDLHKIWFISSQKTEVDQIHIYWKLKAEFFNLNYFWYAGQSTKGLKYIFYILVLESMGMILGGSAFFENHSIFFFWFLLLNKSQDTCICVEGGRVSTQWWLFTYNSSSLEQTYFPHQMVIAQCHV